MAIMKLKCPICGEELEVDIKLNGGEDIRCAACGRIFAYRLLGEPRRPSNQEGIIPGTVVPVIAIVLMAGALCWLLFGTNRSAQCASADNDSNEQTYRDGEMCGDTARQQKSSQQAIKYYGDPLDEYRLGECNGSRQEDFAMCNFLFFNTMKITYTSKGRIALINLKVNDSEGLAVANTDYIVNSLMKRCDEKFGSIDWVVGKQSSGGKCARGRCFFQGELDKIFILEPSGCGGFEALLFSVSAKREDDGYKCPESLYK